MLRRIVISFCLLAVVLITEITLPAQATPPNTTGNEAQGAQSMAPGMAGVQMRARARLNWLTQELNLTDAQRGQLAPILEGEVQQMRSVLDNSSLSETERQSKLRQIRETNRPKIRAVLTPEQQKKLAEMMAQRNDF